MKAAKIYTPAPYLLFALLLFNPQAISAIQDWGRVNMQGAILETACAIATESREQIIDMETIPVSDIARDGYGRSMPFNIELVNCIFEHADKKIPDGQKFKVTFDGSADGEFFWVKGEASGVALRISDAAGNIARPGIPMPSLNMMPINYRLNYAMTLVGNNRPLKAGDYFSSVRFKMDYY